MLGTEPVGRRKIEVPAGGRTEPAARPHGKADPALHAGGPVSPGGPGGGATDPHDRRLGPGGEPAPSPGDAGRETTENEAETAAGAADLDTACTALRWYELRWRIERFFHALKVGTRVEDRRLDEADDLRRCLAFDAITAFRVWDLSLLARERPGDPAGRQVTEEDIRHSVPSPPTMASRFPEDRRT